MENKKVRIHVSVNPALLVEVAEYLKEAVGRPTLSGAVETGLEMLMDSVRKEEKDSGNSMI